MRHIDEFPYPSRVMGTLGVVLVRFPGASRRCRTALAAENLFRRKQLAVDRERQVQPRHASDPLRLAPVLLARCFAGRQALTIVHPTTLVRWHRQAFCLLWRWRSRVARPRLPIALRHPIREMARDNPTWGEERIAAELLVKLGVRVSPRPVRRSKGRGLGGGGQGATGHRWATFVRNHLDGPVYAASGSRAPQSVGRTAHTLHAAIQDMGVGRRTLEVFVEREIRVCPRRGFLPQPG